MEIIEEFLVIPINSLGGKKFKNIEISHKISPEKCRLKRLRKPRAVYLVNAGELSVPETIEHLLSHGFKVAPYNYLLGLGEQHSLEIEKKYEYISSLDTESILSDPRSFLSLESFWPIDKLRVSLTFRNGTIFNRNNKWLHAVIKV